MESQSLQESPEKSSAIIIPEDFESHKEMVRMGMNVLHRKLLVDFPDFLYFITHSESLNYV